MPSTTQTRVAALVYALKDERENVPRSMLYMALGWDLDTYYVVEAMAAELGFLVHTAETIRITTKGQELALKLHQEVVKTAQRRVEQIVRDGKETQG